MKKQIYIQIIMLVFSSLLAQAQSNTFNFQGIARDAAGQIISGKTINVRLSVRDGGTAGTIKYQETRTATTNTEGLFSAQLGQSPNSSTGSLINLDWSTGTKFLQVEIDPNNGTNFVSVSNAQMTSVPFVKATEMTGGFSPDAKLAPTQIAPEIESGVGSKYLRFNGTSWKAGIPFTKLGTFTFPLASAANLSTPAFLISNNFVSPGMYLKSKGKTATVSATTGIGTVLSNNSTSPTLNINNSNMISGAGLEAISNTGTALNLTTAAAGFAMDLNGRVMITGGNTNPAADARLTSDASGNATWKKLDQSISCQIPDQPSALSAELAPATGDLVVPVSGVYAISAHADVEAHDYGVYYVNAYLKEASIIARIKRNGNLVQTINAFHREFDTVIRLYPTMDTFVYLKAGDRIEVRLKVQSITENAFNNGCGFRASLVFAE